MIEAELQSFVNILRRSNSFLQHVEGFVSNHRIDTAGDEARRFLNHDNFLAHPPSHLGCSRERVLISLKPAHDLEQLHFVYWVEEMHSDTFLGAVADAGDFGNAQ